MLEGLVFLGTIPKEQDRLEINVMVHPYCLVSIPEHVRGVVCKIRRGLDRKSDWDKVEALYSHEMPRDIVTPAYEGYVVVGIVTKSYTNRL
jgi:hypothetical protein